MRRPLLPTLLAAAAAAAAAALAGAGCGAEDADPTAVADAASQTRRAETARIDLRVSASGFGLPGRMTLRGDGTTALDVPRMALDLDLGPVLALAGAGGDGRTSVVVRGKDLYVDPPAVPGLRLPGGADWIALDLAETLEAAGPDLRGVGDLMALDPGAQLDVLRAAKGIEEVGEERVRGVDTTHYRGSVQLAEFVDALPPARRERARRAVERIVADTPGGDVATPFDVWVDGRDRILRMKQRTDVPAQQGLQRGRVDLTFELSDFGAPVRAPAPAARETFDATSAARRAVGASSRPTR